MQDDPLRQRQAAVYNRARRRLSWADSAASLVVLVGIVHWADRLGGWGCVLALAVVLPLISLPFEYAGEVLSRRNGLSRQTTGGWLADQAKARAIGLVLGGLIALGLLGLGRLWPNWWPVPAWGGAMVVSVALSVLFPVLLLPLFMKSEPLSDGPMADSAVGDGAHQRRAGQGDAAAAHGREDLGRERDGGRPGADAARVRGRHHRRG